MKINKVVIPAAGMGTRFLPATKAMPKEMLPIVDKPSIQYVIEEAIDAALKDILIITGRGKRALEDHFDSAYELEAFLKAKGDTAKLDLIKEFDKVNLSYTRQKQALGLGHAILQAEAYVGNEAFAVMLPDDIVSDGGELLGRMVELSIKESCSVVALIEVTPEEAHKYGIVAIEGAPSDGIVKIKDMVEKPSKGNEPSLLAIAGRYVIQSQVFEILKNQPKGAGGEIQLTDALKTMSNSKEHSVYGIIHKGRRFDTGDKLGLIKANIEFALARKELSGELLEWLNVLINKKENN